MMMATVFRSLPEPVSAKLYYKFFKPLPARYAHLFSGATLRHARGVAIDLPRSKDAMYECIALTGGMEAQLSRRVAQLSRDGGVMIDVGANIGYFSMIWLAGNERNRSICLEPAPRVFEYLRRNVERNGFSARADLVMVAAGSSAGVQQFNLLNDDPTGWGRFAEAGESGKLIDVEVRALDELVGNDQVVTFLKIDAEGSEAAVMQGCMSLVRDRRIRHIYIEETNQESIRLGLGTGQATQLLADNGYRLTRLQQHKNPRVDHWWASA